MSIKDVGPMHIHKGKSIGWPRAMTTNPAFLVEFGKKGEDYGGFLVFYLGGYPRERDGLQTYYPQDVAALIAKAPELLKENNQLNARMKAIREAISATSPQRGEGGGE